jgi:hypothetical protein
MPRDIWDEYGYHRNPFEPRALSATGEDAHLFVGREKEVETLSTWYVSSHSGGVIVEGPIGVGKTTLVNMAQHKAHVHDAGILPCLKTVETQDGMTPQAFLLEVLAHVLYNLQRMDPGVESMDEFQTLEQAVERGVLTSKGWQAHASLAGSGGGGGRQTVKTPTQPDQLTMMAVHRYLERVLQLARDRGFNRILVSINNLDIVDLDRFKGLLQAVRDSSLALDGYLWTFIGPVGLRGELGEPAVQRVSELLRGAPVELGPLTLEQVQQAISARLKVHRKSPQAIPPVEDDVVRFLYDASNGEIRYVLNRCGDIVEAITRHLPSPTPVTLEKARWVLRDIVAPAIEHAGLKPKEQEVLRKIADRRRVQGKDFAEYGFNQYQGLFNHISSLAEKRLLVKERMGRDVVYVPRGDVVLFFEADPMGAWF